MTALELIRIWRDRELDSKRELAYAVRRARTAGLSWKQIARALGITEQAACERFKEIDQ